MQEEKRKDQGHTCNILSLNHTYPGTYEVEFNPSLRAPSRLIFFCGAILSSTLHGNTLYYTLNTLSLGQAIPHPPTWAMHRAGG